MAELEYTKLQLLGSLDAVAAAMRNAAQLVEQYAQLVASLPPYHPVPPILPNGTLPQLPQQPVSTPVADGKRRKRLDDDEGKKKKDKRPKDPNAPKRPASSYLLFQNEVRRSLKEEHPHIANNELLQMIAKAWAEMPQEQKDAYEDRQKAAKDQYLAEKAAYERTKGGVVPAQADASATSPVSAGTEPSPATPAAPIVTPVTPAAKGIPAVAAEASDTEDSSSEEEEEESSNSGSDEEESKPPAKKQKKAPTPPPEPQSKKKHKKTKA